MTRGSLVSKKQDALRNKLHNKRRGVSADGKGAAEVQYININIDTNIDINTLDPRRQYDGFGSFSYLIIHVAIVICEPSETTMS